MDILPHDHGGNGITYGRVQNNALFARPLTRAGVPSEQANSVAATRGASVIEAGDTPDGDSQTGATSLPDPVRVYPGQRHTPPFEECRMSIQTQPDDKSTWLTRTIGNITGWLGSFPAILVSFVLVFAWLVGALFVSGHFANNTYQLLINTGTTIITFWMVFIIQNTQNRDGRAMQAKLDAQSEILRRVADTLDIDDDEALLTRTVGLEDAPEHVIKHDQDLVRTAAVDTGQHGIITNTE